MKFANRIFLVLGAMSVFSLVQFDAMGAESGCNSVAAGNYCLKKNHKNNCPAGCYCERKTDVDAVANINGLPSDDAVRYACAMKDQSKKAALESRGVYYCLDNQTSPSGSKYSSDCKTGKTAYDGSDNCTGTVNGGYYCLKKNSHKECPKGCYCDGSKYAVGERWWNASHSAWETIPVSSWCNNHSGWLKDYLVERGIHYCPDEFPGSPGRISSEDDCWVVVKKKNNQGIEYNAYVYKKNATMEVQPGEYFKKGYAFTSECESGYYCPGGTLTISAISDVGIYRCNGVVTNNKAKCTITCNPGQYFDVSSLKCLSCGSLSNNQYCPNTTIVVLPDDNPSGNRGIQTCPGNKIAAQDRKSCINDPTNCNYTVTYRNNYPISNIASVTANDLRAELSAMGVEERTERFDTTEEVSANFDRVNSPVATQNSQTGLCQGASVTLHNAPTAPNGYTFNYWGCNQNIGHKMPGATFNMPAGNVICTAQWTYSGSTGGDNGGGTGGSTGGDNGGGTGGSTGGDNGGGTGGSTGGDNGGGTGGSTGGDNGGGTGGSTGGDNTGDGDDNTPVSCTTPGKYWNGDYCENCESGYFCPGDGDEYRCPIPLSQTSSGASCRGNVSKTQMYGNNCWKYTGNASNYRNCVYGIRLENYRH